MGYLGLLYVHFGLAAFGLVPLWTLLLSAPILVVRWLLAVHELFHLRNERQVDAVTRLRPLMLTPFSLGYRELLDIHRRHHRYTATPDDPEYYTRLVGFVNAMSAPEQAYARWLAYRRMDLSLLRDILARLILFAAMIAGTGWAFFGYWVPVRIAYGAAYFSFFYCLHRRAAEYGVYPLRFSPLTERLFAVLFGREALYATCHHDVHHANARVAALLLPQARHYERGLGEAGRTPSSPAAPGPS